MFLCDAQQASLFPSFLAAVYVLHSSLADCEQLAELLEAFIA
jgi:hypothetical protein